MISVTSARRNSPSCAVRLVMGILPEASRRQGGRAPSGTFRPRRLAALLPPRLGPRYLFPVEELDLVADLEVVEVVQAETALVAGRHFPHVLLEALERLDRPFVDDRTA